MLFDELNTDIGMKATTNTFAVEQLKTIKNKLNDLNKERIELICKCIKSSIQLISKLMKYFDNLQNSKNDNETLIQIKLLCKITRSIVNNANIEIRRTNNKREKEFFTM